MTLPGVSMGIGSHWVECAPAAGNIALPSVYEAYRALPGSLRPTMPRTESADRAGPLSFAARQSADSRGRWCRSEISSPSSYQHAGPGGAIRHATTSLVTRLRSLREHHRGRRTSPIDLSRFPRTESGRRSASSSGACWRNPGPSCRPPTPPELGWVPALVAVP
jgi:hypothetical protein